MITLLMLLSVALSSGHDPIVADDASTPSPIAGVRAVRIDVVDLEASLAFYRDHLGFTFSPERIKGRVRLENHGVPIILRQVDESQRIAEESCHVRLNLYTSDLEGVCRRLESAGVQVLAAKQSQVSDYRSVRDPSGNPINLKQLFDGRETDGLLRVYNLGVSVTDMTLAERFYVEGLGFSVFSRTYYPPVIPLIRKGVSSFILSDGAKLPASEGYGSRARIMLQLETEDLESALARLSSMGARLLGSVATGPEGRTVAFEDPFNNVIELLESKPLASSAPSIDALSWLSGCWAREGDEGFLEETWSSPRSDAMTGMFRWVRDDGTWLYELMAIEEDDGEIVFRLRHFSRGLVPWKSEADSPFVYPLARMGENEVVFENPERDRPRRFMFRREGDELLVRLETSAGEADELRFRRQAEESSRDSGPSRDSELSHGPDKSDKSDKSD